MPTGPESILEGALDAEMWDVFATAVGHDTAVRDGEFRIDPHDPRLTSFMYEVGAPLLQSYGATTHIDETNNLIATFGPLSGDEILFVAYPANHHGNNTPKPHTARKAKIAGEEAWVGLGAGQGKGGLAALCSGLAVARTAGHELGGHIAVALSSEASSTHHSATALYAGLRPPPAAAILTVGTNNKLCIGTRGRVDLLIHIYGRSAHTSAAELGRNPIPVIADVLGRLRGLVAAGEPHPLLGSRAAVPYRLTCGPIYPHTVPDTCELVIDCRTLPGDEPTALVSRAAELFLGLPVTVTQGATMRPAEIDRASPLVRRIQDAAERTLKTPLAIAYPAWTFDAGYPCSLGIPAVTYGPSSADVSGTDVAGLDFVNVTHLRQAGSLYADLMFPPTQTSSDRMT